MEMNSLRVQMNILSFSSDSDVQGAIIFNFHVVRALWLIYVSIYLIEMELTRVES